MSLAKVLKSRRSELGYTLLEIADKMGVSEATVQRWESGNIKSLRQGRISQLAEILKVSPAVLMGWEEEKALETEVSKADERFEKIWTMYSALSDSEKDAADKYLAFLLENQKND